MRKHKLLIFCITGLMVVYGLDLSYAGVVLVDTSSMTAEEVAQMRTETLERTKAKIDYCLANLGKNINEVDLKQVGDNDANLCVITYGLIAQKYYRPYNDIGKAADYYYLEWKHTHGSECGSPDETGKIIIDCAGKDKGPSVSIIRSAKLWGRGRRRANTKKQPSTIKSISIIG